MTPSTRAQWEQQLETLAVPSEAFIDGGFTDSASGATFDNVSPVTGATISEVSSCDVDDVDRAVRSARQAFKSGEWSRCDPATRKATLIRLADLIERDLEQLALLESMDMGKPINDALTIDVPGSAAIFRWYAEALDKLYGEIAPTAPGDLALIDREPLGVVGAVVPWNFPLEMATWKLAPALGAGNSVVLKPAEQSPSSALRLASLATEAGLPPGVLQVVPGLGHTAGQAIGRHQDIDCVTFTGSTEIGKRFLSYAGESNMKQVWLECGGKSPNLIFADCADLEAAADMAAFGIFFNQGEICSANSRLLVQRDVQGDLVELLQVRALDAAPSHPLDPTTKMGALVSEEHVQRVMAYIDTGKTEARLVVGGNRCSVSSDCFVEPTIFDNVPPDATISNEEIFGPVLAVHPFDSEPEAVELANATAFGLAASVWTNDLSRALRVGKHLHAGTVSINTVDALSHLTPFGGFKQSGFGRDLSLHALDKFSGLKTTWIKYQTESR